MGCGSKNNTIPETEAEKKAAQINIERWNRSMEKFEPLKKMYLDKVDNMDSEGRRSYATGKASQDVQTAYSNAGRQLNRSKFNSGVNPNSGNFKSGTLADAEAASSSTNTSGAEISLIEGKGRGYLNALKMGRGEETTAQAGLNEIAEQSQRQAFADAQSRIDASSTRKQNIGSLGGLAAYNYQKQRPPEQDEPIQTYMT